MGLARSTLVDLKNGLPPRQLADRVHARGIVFVHVPKCAGTSVENALRRHYRLSRYMIDPETSFSASRLYGEQEQHARLGQASELRRHLLHYALATGYKCITGHAPLGPHTIRAAADSHDFITVLRDPIERFHSHLRFNQTEQSGHGRIEMPVEAFLKTPRAKVMGNLYGKYFSGLPMSADFSGDEAIALSKQQLEQFQVVGFLDQLAGFSEKVSDLMGKTFQPGHDNRTNSNAPQTKDSLSMHCEEIKNLCRADIEIYTWAKAKFG
ncbi:MAG: sulfotransferase family protein [Aquisalinus sp.]|nr:sulfotransferase family protein [Aquisalinus sp.]